MEQTNKEQEELFIVYKTLLATLEECKASQYLAKFSKDIEKQIEDFIKEYPELILEYYYEEYNK